MIKCGLLKDSLKNAAKFISKINDLGKNFVLKSDGSFLEIFACDGNLAYYCCLENKDGAVFDIAVRGSAFIAIVEAFQAEDEIIFDIRRQDLILSTTIEDDDDDSDEVKMPFEPSENSWRVPMPDEWKKVSEEVRESILVMRRFPIRQKNPTMPTSFVMRDNALLCISPYFIYHETCEHDFNLVLMYDNLIKVVPGFTSISQKNNNVYFGDSSEWCMIPEHTGKVPDHRPLLKEVQKTNICVININVSDLTNLLSRFKAVAKAEDELSVGLLSSNANQIELRMTPTVMLVTSPLAKIRIPISTVSDFEELTVKTSIDFLLSMVKDLLSRDSDSVSLNIGYSMRMVNATCDARQILGTVYR